MFDVSSRRLLSALLAGGLLVSACSGSGDDDVVTDSDANAIDDDATTSESLPTDDGGDAATSGVAPADPTDPAAPADGAPAPDSGTPAADAPPAEQPPAQEQPPAEQPPAQEQPPAPQNQPAEAAPTLGQPSVPKAGTYTYASTTTDEDGTRNETHEQTVQRLSGDDTSGKIVHTIPDELGTLEVTASVGPNGTIWELLVVRGTPLGDINCDWDPDIQVLPALAAGATWSFESGCEDTSKGSSVEVSGTGKVVGTETISVNGTSVDVWVVDSTTVQDFTVTAFGTGHTETTTRSWIDPARGMSVKSESTSESTGDFGEGSSSRTLDFTGFAA